MIGPWPHGDPRDVARAVVADPRFERGALAPAPQPTWFDALRSWAAGIVRGFFQALDRALGAHNPLDTALGFAVLAVAFALLAWGAYVVVRSFARGARPRPRAEALSIIEAAPQSAEALRAAARAAARAGRFREAAALLFESAMRALDERGRMGYDPARTPGEYRRLLRDPGFDALADDAVVALFAAAEPAAELFERMNRAYERCFDARTR